MHILQRATLMLGSFGNEVVDENSWVDCLQNKSSYLIIELLWWSYLLTSIYMGHKYFHILQQFGEIYPHSSSDHDLSKSFTAQTTHWLKLTNWWRFAQLAISLSKQNIWPWVQPEVLATIKISLHQCLSGLSRKGIVILQLFTLCGVCIMYRTNQVLVFPTSVNWLQSTYYDALGECLGT